ncbi:MAG: hypothetical protein O3A29_21380 [Planctomycetota bacterium]|nr:hypothetical protein [Planctomycetota bacterium]
MRSLPPKDSMLMNTFDQLAASRREWISQVLIPWCRAASLKELRKAADEWPDIAGKVTADATLWTWAWSRFPVLVLDDLPGVNETWEVHVQLQDGREFVGYPDGKRTKQGSLVLLGREVTRDSNGPNETAYIGPLSIDDIVAVERSEP